MLPIVDSNDVTVIDGQTLAKTTVAADEGPLAVAVNTVTKKIYVGNQKFYEEVYGHCNRRCHQSNNHRASTGRSLLLQRRKLAHRRRSEKSITHLAMWDYLASMESESGPLHCYVEQRVRGEHGFQFHNQPHVRWGAAPWMTSTLRLKRKISSTLCTAIATLPWIP